MILIVSRVYGRGPAARFIVGMVSATAAQHVLIAAVRARVGKEHWSAGDILTLGRFTTAAVLAGLVASGIQDRTGAAGWLSWLSTLFAASMTDWLDGPLARRAGPTKLGAVLDIEADSWLTLWSAVAAVRWGDVPWWCVVPPIMHYLHPALDFAEGKLPSGGGPWWSRVTGVAQMGLILLALSPIGRETRSKLLRLAAFPVSASQGLVMLVLILRRVGLLPGQPDRQGNRTR